MTRFEAAEPRERLALAIDAVTAHRNRGSDGVVLEGRGVADESTARVEYADRVVRVEVDAAERERLDGLLADYPVFKLKQPETRKASEGVVFVSAIADPKHAAEFLDALFRAVYGLDEEYELRVVQV